MSRSGYFTSRPTVKRFSRVGNILLQQLRQLEAQFLKKKSIMDKLRSEVSLMQHHDAITGTEKQFVSNDYMLRLSDAVNDAENKMNEILSTFGTKQNPFSLCLLSNVSICNVSAFGEKIEVLVYNPLAHDQIATIEVPITATSVTVTSAEGNNDVVPSIILSSSPVYNGLKYEAPRQLTFPVVLKPMSLGSYILTMSNKTFTVLQMEDVDVSEVKEEDDIVKLENDYLVIEISRKSGKTVSMTNKKQNLKVPLETELRYYIDRAGAYTFAPLTQISQDILCTRVQVQKDSKGIVRRVTAILGEWGSLEFQLNEWDTSLVVQWTVGPIPIGDNHAKNAFVNFNTSGTIKSANQYYTDSNGLEFLRRTRNVRDTWDIVVHNDCEKVASNYYPITTGIYIKDAKYQLNVVTDRAQGAASLQDGQIEVMVHRRLLEDDRKGVHEALNETETFELPNNTKIEEGLRARGTFRVSLETAVDGIEALRNTIEQAYLSPLIAYRPFTASSKREAIHKATTYSLLPANVGITTIQSLSASCQLIRLTHLYGKDEHKKWSQPATVNFKDWIKRDEMDFFVNEMALDGILTLEEKKKLRSPKLNWKTTPTDRVAYKDQNGTGLRKELNGTIVTLQALEVRAFRICFGNETAEVKSFNFFKEVKSFNFFNRETPDTKDSATKVKKRNLEY